MENLAKHRFALLGAAIVLASTLVTGQTLSVVKAGESSGTLDGTFGNGGIVTNDLFGAFSLAVQPDGKIVTAGQALINGSTDFALARYNSDGTLDASFGTGGTVITDVSGDGNHDHASSVAVQPDGKIVVAGETIISAVFDFSFALARYNRDGTLDASFGTGGIVTTSIGNGSFDFARSVALQPNGKIVAAGQVLFIGGFDFVLARYTRDGTLDAGFGTDGIVITDFAGSGDRALSVGVEPNGRIVVAGNANADFALARYE